MTTEATTGIVARKVLKPIDIRLLGIGTILDFPLYVRGQGDRRFKLLQGPKLPFTQTVFDQIQEDYGGRAYIYPEHVESYQACTKASLAMAFSDPGKKPEEKVRVLMDHVESNLKAVLDRSDNEHIPDYESVSVYPQHVAMLLGGESNTKALIMEFLGKNDSLAAHCLQVCIYGMMVVKRFFSSQFTEKQKEELALGFLCHDIGKVQVGASIMEKPDRPSRLEWKVLHQVPERGAFILNQWGIQDGLAVDIVQNHREHYDGAGYPRQLRGEQIPKMARICCIADDFASLTTRKAYRPALSAYDAIWIMRVDNEGHYDPALLKLFLTMLVE